MKTSFFFAISTLVNYSVAMGLFFSWMGWPAMVGGAVFATIYAGVLLVTFYDVPYRALDVIFPAMLLKKDSYLKEVGLHFVGVVANSVLSLIPYVGGVFSFLAGVCVAWVATLLIEYAARTLVWRNHIWEVEDDTEHVSK